MGYMGWVTVLGLYAFFIFGCCNCVNVFTVGFFVLLLFLFYLYHREQPTSIEISNYKWYNLFLAQHGIITKQEYFKRLEYGNVKSMQRELLERFGTTHVVFDVDHSMTAYYTLSADDCYHYAFPEK